MATTDRFTDQTGHRIRFEWGRAGASALADQVRACVIVDVLSFSTAVSVAADAGIVVHPWPWRLEPGATDATEAVRAARALGATPAAHRDRGRLDPAAVTLSPQSLRRNAASTRRVLLPSPNGATISAALADYGVDVLAGCLRNRSAVARRLATLLDAGESIAILAAGERWPDGTLRPAAEDLLGAGAILSALVEAGHDDLSLEARLAVASWREVAVGRAGFAPRDAAQPGPTCQASLLRAAIGDSASGRELAGRGDAPDLDIAAECDASSIVPQLVSGAFVPHHDGVVIRPATADDAEQVATVWLRAWESALASVRRAHPDDEVRGWVRDILLPGDRTWVAESAGDARAHAGAVVGLLTTHDDWVHQLYVDPSAQGRGIGSALLAVAGARHPNRLELWTFQVNAGARRFYERHGFTAVEFTDGQGNEEREPDVRYLRPAVPRRQPYRGPVDDQGTAS